MREIHIENVKYKHVIDNGCEPYPLWPGSIPPNNAPIVRRFVMHGYNLLLLHSPTDIHLCAAIFHLNTPRYVVDSLTRDIRSA